MQYDLVVSIVIYKPKLSVLQQTLDSLSRSQLNMKVALFDNSPASIEWKNLSCSHSFEYTFNGNNIGYGRAHNQNIFKHIEKSNYVLVLNPDVFFDERLLTSLLQKMEESPDVGLCIPKICHPEGHLQLINRRLPRPQDYLISFMSNKFSTQIFKTEAYKKYLLADVNTNKPYICPIISGCFMLFRSKVFLTVDGFDERYFLYLEDTDLSRRVSEISKTVVFSDLVAFHHWSRGAYSNSKLFFIFLRSLVTYFNKWGWFNDPGRTSLNVKVQPYTSPQNMNKPYKPTENSVLNPAQV
jgi:GT2 family glycosyltransferase